MIINQSEPIGGRKSPVKMPVRAVLEAVRKMDKQEVVQKEAAEPAYLPKSSNKARRKTVRQEKVK